MPKQASLQFNLRYQSYMCAAKWVAIMLRTVRIVLGQYVAQYLFFSAQYQAIVAAAHRMADAVGFACVEEQCLSDVRHHLRTVCVVLNEDPV